MEMGNQQFISIGSSFGENGEVKAFEARVDLKFWWYPVLEEGGKATKKEAMDRMNELSSLKGKLVCQAFSQAFHGMTSGKYCGPLHFVDYHANRSYSLIFQGFWTIQ